MEPLPRELSKSEDMRGIYVMGAGGHGREVLGVVRAAELPFVGFIDDRKPNSKLLGRLDAEYLGSADQVYAIESRAEYLVGIGSGESRSRVVQDVPTGWVPATAIHPMSALDRDVRISPGVVIFAFATVTTNIDLGCHVHIGRGAAVGHDSVLHDFVTVLPLAAVSGNVVVGPSATIGTGAVVRQGITIGAGAFVGAGAVVVSNVEPGATVVGNPARPIHQG